MGVGTSFRYWPLEIPTVHIWYREVHYLQVWTTRDPHGPHLVQGGALASDMGQYRSPLSTSGMGRGTSFRYGTVQIPMVHIWYREGH